MVYTFDAIILCLRGHISLRQLLMVLQTRQIAVIHRRKVQIICRDFAREDQDGDVQTNPARRT